jgi:hypothetical protein
MRRRDAVHRALLLVLLTAGLCATPRVVVAQSIEGRIVDTGGMGLPGVTATAISQTGGAATTISSRADGSFTFEGLPDGVYRIAFELRGFDVVRHNLVRVRAGNATRVDATLRAAPICECIDRWGLSKPALVTHTGQVVDGSGRPLPFVQLEVAGPVGPEIVHANREGRFEVSLPPSRTWRLTARDSGFGAVTIRVSGSTRAPLRLRLPKVDPRKLPAVESLRWPCCPAYFARL